MNIEYAITSFRGAHAPPRAGEGALAFANTAASFGEGGETRTRGACAPQT